MMTRREDRDLLTPAEAHLYAAEQALIDFGQRVALQEVFDLLHQTRSKLADYVDQKIAVAKRAA